jgi:hypothetical protein
VINFPRREKAAAKVGPRLEISPLQIKDKLNNQHGLSSLLTAAESWEPFAWKGNDLSAPLRALFAAEARGLLKNKNNSVAIADIAAEINNYLISFGKKPIAESTVLNNLKTAALYLNAAVNVRIVPDNKTMTVRVLGELETQENIVKYFDEIKGKLDKLNSQVEHAEACGYDMSRVLTAGQVEGAKQLVAAN